MKQELGNLMAEDPQQETINLLNYRLNAVSTNLAAVTEQRDEYKAALQSADNHNHEIATKLEIVTEQRDRLAEALTDMLSGWRYIRKTHGDLYGVGWDRAQTKAEQALQSLNQPTP